MNPRIILPVTDTLQPVLFIGHGDPMNAIRANPFTHALKELGAQLREQEPPAAILCISAHWLTRGSWICASEHPDTIHDFGGFPDELYRVQYPAPGAPALAHLVSEGTGEIGMTTEWGIDHGAWTVLTHMFPEADVAVAQLSIDYARPLRYHYDLAKQLQDLRRRNVLLVGSGNVVHNLRMSMDRLMRGDPSPYDWAVEFDSWVRDRLTNRDDDELIAFEKAGQAASLAVPTVDHYVPLIYALGATDRSETLSTVYEEVAYGGLSMRSIRIG